MLFAHAKAFVCIYCVRLQFRVYTVASTSVCVNKCFFFLFGPKFNVSLAM